MEFLTINNDQGEMNVASAVPSGTAKGAVIIIQEAFGLTEHITGLTDRLADIGYRAVAPELFHRVANKPFAYDDFDSIMPIMQSLTANEINADLEATIALLNGEGFEASSIGMVGFCMGGSLAFYSATHPGIGAAVSFYGGGVATGRFGLPSLIELAPSIRCPWLGLYGDLDQSIPVEDVEGLRSALMGASVSSEIVRYSDAGHGFNCDDRPDHFNAEAAADAWSRTIAFFDSTLTR